MFLLVLKEYILYKLIVSVFKKFHFQPEIANRRGKVRIQLLSPNGEG